MPRRGTGTIRGMTPGKSAAAILAAIKMANSTGGVFVRKRLRQWLQDEIHLTRRQAEGVVSALIYTPGMVERISGRLGTYRVSPGAEAMARNRNWRFNVGRLGLADAWVLGEALDLYVKNGHVLSSNMELMHRLLTRSLRHIPASELKEMK